MEIDYEIISMVILPLRLNQKGQLSVTGKIMCKSCSGKNKKNITNLLSAEFAQRVVNVKNFFFCVNWLLVFLWLSFKVIELGCCIKN